MPMLSLVLLAALAFSPQAVEVPPQLALTQAIEARDAALFGLMFTQCDPAALTRLVTDDMEFYHDKGGLMAHDAFIDDYAKSCVAKKAPDAWRSRRELVAGTLKVYAIPGFGAVEEGAHVFYERKGEGPERMAGKARFSILWKLGADGQWRMARTFSIDHAAAP